MQDILSFFAFAVQFSRTGWGWDKGVPAGLTLIGGAFGMHARGSGREPCETFFLLSFGPLILTDWVWGEGKGYGRLLTLSDGAFGNIPVDRKRARRHFHICASTVYFSQTGWG